MTIRPDGRDGSDRQLVVVAGDDAGRSFPLAPDSTLGRATDSQVSLADGDISRKHARLYRSPSGSWYVEDLGSRNGTFVNDEAVQRASIELGDRVRLGAHAVLAMIESDEVEREIEARQRFEAIGRLSLGIAHDFNNMLAAVTAGIDYLDREDPAELDPVEHQGCVDDMRLAIDRATKLAGRLLQAGRGESQGHERVDVSALCDEVAQLCRRMLPRHILIETDIAPRLGVRGDPVALHQMLMNLVLNARDALAEGGTLRIKAAAATRDSHRTVTIAVCDDGAGMPDDTRDHAFESFFTTKPEGVGFGLGLAAVKRIVERHAGSVEVASHLDQGTVLVVELPADVQLMRREHRTETTHPRIPDGTRVLLADDEPVVRRALRRMLRRQGCSVVEAQTGREAIGHMPADRPAADVAILDIDMPDIDGVEACRTIRERHAQLPILVITGHDHDALRDALRVAGATTVLAKPVEGEQLVESLSSALRLRHLTPEEVDTLPS